MEFCPDCDSRLVQNFEDAGGPKACPKCNPEKIRVKVPTRGVNHSGRTRQCSKGCGAEIYWDEELKSDSGKFIPIDSRTDEPHRCQDFAESDEVYYTDQTKDSTETKSREEIPISQNILYDIGKIPKSLVNGDPIIREIVRGHEQESLALVHYERLLAPEDDKIPIHALNDVLSEDIIKGLERYGFTGLLPFQEESIRAILKGSNSIISAPTGSGKTEAFVIPILQKISKDPAPGVFTLLVYPLNALIDDQISKISDLIKKCGLDDTIAAYSIHGGQSTEYKEMVISDAAQKSLIIATNFDFINYHLILQDRKWNVLFKNAKMLVMDEAHSYTSFHGSNVYHVLNRMKRHMGAVQFVGSSATLENSREFFSDMFDLPKDSFVYIKSKFRRKQDMHMLFVMPRKFKQRMTMEMLSSICYKNKSTQLVFSNSHNDAEFLASNVEEANKGIRIQIHRGGLDQRDRKMYESQMKAGELDALSCTPTLELGIDIGHVDVVISAFKNEFDSFVQRIGRAGRKGQKSYAICVFDPDDATCHYFARHIEQYLSQSHIVSINKENQIISERHKESVEMEDQAARYTDKSQFFDFANSVNLRGTSKEISIYHDSKKIGTRDVPVGYYQLHQKAIYHFNKQNYEVESLIKSQNGARAYLKRSSEKQKRTIPILRTALIKASEVDAIHREIRINHKKISLSYGIISLDRTITGYMKGNYNESVETYKVYNIVNTPSWRNFHWRSRHSAVSIALEEFVSGSVQDSRGTISDDPKVHTVSHVLINASKILTKSESNDIDVYYEDGIIYIYDNSSEGFNGCSRIIYDEFEKILEMGSSLVNECDCPIDKNQREEDWGGCPKCTFTTNYCQTKNKELSKRDAREFFVGFQPR